MYDVVLFGGTDEGHKIADFLSEQKVSYIVCVATEYGAELLDMKNVRIFLTKTVLDWSLTQLTLTPNL